jgi:hypothetical protein
MKVQGITFTIDREKLKRSLVAAINRGVTDAAVVYVDGIKKSFSKTARGTSSAPGQPPSVQRGALRRAIDKTPTKNGKTIVHTSNLRYAPVLEYGATIRAKPGKALPVPIGPAGKRILESAGKGGLKNSGVRMTMIKRKGKAPLLVRTVNGRNARSEVLFILKKSITIKPRPFMAPAERSATLYAAAVAAFEAGASAEIRRAV